MSQDCACDTMNESAESAGGVPSSGIQAVIQDMGQRARRAAGSMATASPMAKAAALTHLAHLLEERQSQVLEANARDCATARAAGLDAPRLDRLTLTPAVMAEMAEACRYVAGLGDAVGAIEEQWQRPNGLLVGRMRIPLGVVAMIFESRPNVTVDAAILCLKAGNAVILRGGSEAVHSNTALGNLLHEALAHVGLNPDAAQVVGITDREAVTALCKLDQYIDVMIPRGGESLVRTVCATATMPVLKHYKGVCHVYVDAGAALEQALEIVFNGKVQRPGACNSLECLLIHRDEAATLLPMVAARLGGAGVEFRACPVSLPLLGSHAVSQQPGDLGHEFHDLILAVRVVDSFDAALDHIAAYGSQHTEVICTNNHEHAMRFVRGVDASLVAVNASSRFNDGGQLGLGAEIGISTSKLHAFGPMGVRELTTTKFVAFGEGQVRSA